ncbi:CaiB/BaiF CoA transferase family protein [Nocardia jiangxiensis]|uniref:CaiB/BaiF CoA transferase family protein n=1 Tax=Nocardia jiangxiensis TaxID=282685 RepID=A0ABW6SE14_9NOCA
MTGIDASAFTGYLGRIRVLEVGDELGEYCGKVLAGLGADVVRIEPPTGEVTRTYGPFYEDVPDPNRSLHFWHYNVGKRSVTLDLEAPADQAEFRILAKSADIVIDSRPRGYMTERGIGYEEMAEVNPGLIWARITPFGDSGPWADYEASDLVHLALGGVMMNCGYDPDPTGFYETPPIAPQMWQAYHIAGEMTVIAILGALNYRLADGGKGQFLSTAVHEAVSKNTENDIPNWIFERQTHLRLTCRHSMPQASGPALSATKDGRYLLPYRTYLRSALSPWDGTVELLKDYGFQADLDDSKYDGDHRYTPEAIEHIQVQTDKLVSRLLFDRDLWRQAQEKNLPWAAVRRPEENIDDDHWQARNAFVGIHHPELGRSFTYIGAKWLDHDVAWQHGPRPPMIGEHNDAVRSEWTATIVEHKQVQVNERSKRQPLISEHGKPFALSNVRVIDLSWMLASAGAGRFLSALGAEVIKVEHESRWDGMRWSRGIPPEGGRTAREKATSPLTIPPASTPNESGAFMEINSGKLSMSLNLKDPSARELLEDLIRDADMIVEGFSPGTMVRMGLSYERMKQINPSIIYVQQSGFGEYGTYGRTRAYGPTAAAIAGISEMSGLPESYPPAGIGYSYLDWFGAYNMANAMLAALYRRNATGLGCHIDASQAETGLYLTGSAILNFTANGRRWQRYGNRSPYKPAAPHGAYRTAGTDRWIALASFTEAHWSALISVLSLDALADDPRFATLERRLENLNELDALITEATLEWDGFELMTELQQRKFPAGVCQNAQDRYDNDPQLKALDWLVELDQAYIGRWPVRELPTKMSVTPPYIGGRLNRSGPSYGQDTDYVLNEILKLDESAIRKLRETGSL